MHSIRLRFAMATSSERAAAAFEELRAIVAETGFIELEPVWVASYAALLAAVAGGACDAAWAPPLVARDLVELEGANPVAVALRAGRVGYYGALVVARASGVRRVLDLVGARIGWVSRLSAAGYVVPRCHLAALGFDPTSMFGAEVFCSTHDRSARALVRREVDVIATYAHDAPDGSLVVPHVGDARIVAAAGPIPCDVVVVGAGCPPEAASRLAEALVIGDVAIRGPLERLMAVERFAAVPDGHLAPLRRWRLRAEQQFLSGEA